MNACSSRLKIPERFEAYFSSFFQSKQKSPWDNEGEEALSVKVSKHLWSWSCHRANKCLKQSNHSLQISVSPPELQVHCYGFARNLLGLCTEHCLCVHALFLVLSLSYHKSVASRPAFILTLEIRFTEVKTALLRVA